MKLINIPYRILMFSLVFTCCFVCLPDFHAQNSNSPTEKTLNEEEINDLVDLAKYDKTVKRLKPKKRNQSAEDAKEKVEDTQDEEIETGPSFSFSGGPIITWMLYVIIAALVVFILVAIFSSIKVEKDIKKEAIPTDQEIEDIEVINAEEGLESALKAENYRDAVRMLFIKLLQILVEEGSIKWRPEKTNRDYLREMNTHLNVVHFSNLVMAYERVWYGRSPIDKPFFDFLRLDFEKFYSTKNVKVDEAE